MSAKQKQKKNGIKVKLYSEYPFPNRNKIKLDKFQENAIAFFKVNPNSLFKEVESLHNKTILRVAVADKLIAQTCVDCHNSYPGTPRSNWQLGDVRGVLEVEIPMSMISKLNYTTKINTLIYLILFSLIILLSVYFCIKALKNRDID